MNNRRRFLRTGIIAILGGTVFLDPVVFVTRKAFAFAKDRIDSMTDRIKNLRLRNPKDVRRADVPVTPIEEFGSMGLDDHQVDLRSWRLRVEGNVEKPSKPTYEQVKKAPSLKRTVLLICPGVFANNGEWEGVSVKGLLDGAGVKRNTTHVTFYGPEGPYEKVFRVPIEDVTTDRVFLAYAVNDTVLPQKYGFPLRLVAEGYYGYEWVVMVHRA